MTRPAQPYGVRQPAEPHAPHSPTLHARAAPAAGRPGPAAAPAAHHPCAAAAAPPPLQAQGAGAAGGPAAAAATGSRRLMRRKEAQQQPRELQGPPAGRLLAVCCTLRWSCRAGQTEAPSLRRRHVSSNKPTPRTPHCLAASPADQQRPAWHAGVPTTQLASQRLQGACAWRVPPAHAPSATTTVTRSRHLPGAAPPTPTAAPGSWAEALQPSHCAGGAPAHAWCAARARSCLDGHVLGLACKEHGFIAAEVLLAVGVAVVAQVHQGVHLFP